MNSQANYQAEITSWNEEPYVEDEGGRKLTKASVTQNLKGDLEGASSWESLMCYREDGTATYVGLDRVVGRVGGREGSFVVQSSGEYDGTTARATGTVVEGSGTGDLRSVRGTMTSAATSTEVSYTLDYELD